jgi:acetate kinase
MEYLGLKIDADLNDKASRRDAKFSADDSKVEAWVLPTNEELMIARDTKEIVEKL